MSKHSPIGACCARPRFGDVGDIDNGAWTYKSLFIGLTRGAKTRDRLLAVAGVLVAAAALYACAALLLAR